MSELFDESGLNEDNLDEIVEKKQKEDVEKIGAIFSEGGIIKDFKPDYIPRESQIEAAKHILETLQKRGITILEGPCGFGKTFAYLIPLFMDITQTAGRRSVIVTNGISLQEQLYYKDIPFVSKIFKTMYGRDVTYAMLKGKGNFICQHKMSEIMVTRNMSGSMTSRILQLYNDKKIENGDISHLDFVPDSATMSEVACIEEGECQGSGCEFYDKCFYQQARAKASESRIVVTNYHMLFSDLKAQGNILGIYNNLIFDEAHEISNIYRDFLEERISCGTITSIRNKFSEISKQDETIKDRYIKGISFDWILSATEIFFEKVQRSLFVNPAKDEIKMLDSSINLCLYPNEENNFIAAVNQILSTSDQIYEYCSERIEQIKSGYESVYDLPPQVKEEYNKYASIANKLCPVQEKLFAIRRLVKDHKGLVEDDNMVYWVENKDKKVSIHTKPISVAEKLYGNFFNNTYLSCIITSATLSVNGNFNYIKEQLGLDWVNADGENGKELFEYIGKSPFDLTKQELWYLPMNIVDGDARNAKRFQEALPDQIIELLRVTKGGALCLFTSYSNMNYAHAAVARALPQLRIMKQGDLPRTKLTENFKNDRDSVLFATRSFFTGVDIPGDSLRCLIIDKFPFPSPGDPIMMKIQKLYKDQTFAKHFIPEMVITLKQAVGRGVRTVDDKCVVTILDGRMVTAQSYKGIIFNSFPYEKTGTREIEDVKNFLEG
jgi:ATP-dependent DNA helicase DinG